MRGIKCPNLLSKTPSKLSDLEAMGQACMKGPEFCASNHLTLAGKIAEGTRVEEPVTISGKRVTRILSSTLRCATRTSNEGFIGIDEFVRNIANLTAC